MKILMISEAYTPIVDGVAVHVQSLSRQLSARGHKVSVCTIRQRGLPEYEEEDNLRIYRLKGFFQKIPGLYQDPAEKGHPPVRDWLISRVLAQIINREKPDIIHAHGWMLYSVLPLIAKARIPIAYTLHDYRLFCPKMIPVKQNAICNESFTRDCIFCLRPVCGLLRAVSAYVALKRNANKLESVSKFIALNSQVKEDHMKHLGIGSSKIEAIPNFCDSTTNSDKRGYADLPDEFIMFAGKLSPQKGADVLIEAYQRLNTNVKLLVFGKETPGCHYQSTGNIFITKNASRNTVIQAMSKSKFVVVPSICYDTFPTVALEAMSQRKAVIASDIGGLKNIVADWETGILVPRDNPVALSDAILHLIERPEAALKMGERGYSIFLKNFAPDVVIPKIINIYESLIGS
jgi:glycosyltransferase involved in cell wall biosynthesis